MFNIPNKSFLGLYVKNMDVRKKPAPKFFNSSHHRIDVGKISEGANFVIETLRSSGYDALLVGGCVRDLILQNVPNDFDVVTNAKPRDIIKIFGRKSFRLVE